MIDREYLDRLVRATPVAYYASGVDGARAFWPWRMNKAGGPMGPESRKRHAAKCDHYVLDSNFKNDEITNRHVLDEAAEMGADAVVLADVYQDYEATVSALADGLELAANHHYDGTIVLPLQAPHADAYDELESMVGPSDDVWWAIGGVKDAPVSVKVNAARQLRERAGPDVHIHGLGFGVTDELSRVIRTEPGLLDSIDNATAMSNSVSNLSGTPEKMTISAARATAKRLEMLRALTHYADEDPEDLRHPDETGLGQYA